MKLVLPTLYWPTMSTMGLASKSAGFMGGEWKCAYRLDSSNGRIWRSGSGGEFGGGGGHNKRRMERVKEKRRVSGMRENHGMFGFGIRVLVTGEGGRR